MIRTLDPDPAESPPPLEIFNTAEMDEARAMLRPCANIDRWVDLITASRPFPNAQALLTAANSAAASWTPEEVDAALATHPRIGEPSRGDGLEASMSTAEQAASTAADATTRAALAAGNQAYEEKFGRIFLVRAAERSGPEILEALQRRLAHSAQEEQAVVAEQLREIALLRLQGVLNG